MADRYRSDLPSKHPQYSPKHGFNGVVNASSGARTVCAVARNQGTGSDASLGCQSVTFPEPATTPSPTQSGPAPASSTAPPPARSPDDSCPSGRVPTSQFTDTAASVHATAIDCAVWWELTSGTTSTTYSPCQGVTRAQMASFLARLIQRSGGQLPSSPSDAFSDDGAAGSHETAINQLAAVGLVNGKASRVYAGTALMAGPAASLSAGATGGGFGDAPDVA